MESGIRNPESGIRNLDLIRKEMKLIPVFDIPEYQFSRYEKLFNHLIMVNLDLSKIKKIFTFKKNATPQYFFCP